MQTLGYSSERTGATPSVSLLERAGWLEKFHAAVSAIPEIVEVHRLTGNFDYILKIVLPDVEHYDVVYKQLVSRIELFDMSAYISMETVKAAKGVPTNYA